MPGKPENRESMKGSDNRHPKQKETVEGDMYCGSSNSDGIRFKVHNMPDKSVMTPEDK